MEIIYIDKILEPKAGMVLLEIPDTYWTMQSKGGVLLQNAAVEEAKASSPGFDLHNWIPRFGKVVAISPDKKTPDYDWEPNKNEIKIGDDAYFPIVYFFDFPVFKTTDNKMYLMMAYQAILAVRRGDSDELTPVNGYYLFSRVKDSRTYFEYVVEKDTDWYILEKKGFGIEYREDDFNHPHCWNENIECYLMVPPIKLESELKRLQDKEYYLAQKRHILIGIK